MKQRVIPFGLFILLAVWIGSLAAQTESAAPKVDLGLKGVGINLGYVMPSNNYLNTIGFGGEVDFGSLVTPDGDKNKVINVRLRLDLEYWKTHRDLDNKKDDDSDDEVLSDFSISIGPKLRFEVPESDIKPYIIAELGMHFVSDKKIRETNSSTPFQFRIGAGAEYNLTPQFVPILQVRLNVGDTNSFGIFGGVIYRF